MSAVIANNKQLLPQHIAIVMDGNGRWAQQRGKHRGHGHRAGRDALKETVKHCAELGISVLTVFAFSSENWNRPASEVRLLMDLLKRALSREIKELHENDIRVRFIGHVAALKADIQKRIAQAEHLTANNTGLLLNVALNYGGRWDIAQACARVAAAVQSGELNPENIDSDTFSQYLSMADLPDPDLVIRTGGELRVSNFVLWQLAYSELYFTDCLWPDFDAEQLDLAIQSYQQRQRRFGHTPEQASKARSA